MLGFLECLRYVQDYCRFVGCKEKVVSEIIMRTLFSDENKADN